MRSSITQRDHLRLLWNCCAALVCSRQSTSFYYFDTIRERPSGAFRDVVKHHSAKTERNIYGQFCT